MDRCVASDRCVLPRTGVCCLGQVCEAAVCPALWIKTFPGSHLKPLDYLCIDHGKYFRHFVTLSEEFCSKEGRKAVLGVTGYSTGDPI